MFVNSTLGKSFLQAQATGIVRYKALFLNVMQSMSSAIKSFGSIAKTGLAGLAIYAVISAISTVWSKISELKNSLREINEETVKSLGEIGALSSSYNDLAKAADGANGKMKDADVQRSIDERRIALQKLIDLAAKNGLEIKINVDEIREEYAKSSLRQAERGNIAFGKKAKVDPRGKFPTDVWEISTLNSMAKERVGYDTQKPKKLLEKIVKGFSNEGDVIADFFCGSGTSLVVAKELGRQYIGCDINPRAVEITNKRLND